MGVGHAKKKNCRSLARGISHGDKFGNLIKKLQKFGTGYFARGQIREPHKKIAEVWHGVFRTGTNSGTWVGTCGRVAADKSDNVWHWHQACEWAMLKKKNCRSLARGQIREPHMWVGHAKKKMQKFGTGYFARGQIREPHRYLRQGCSRQKRQCMALAPGMWVGHPKKKKKS